MEVAGVAIGHSPHAKDHIGLEPGCGGTQTRCKPIEMQVKGLERAVIQVLAEVSQRSAGSEGEEGRGMSAGAERPGEQKGLALGAAAAEIVLNDENFHCRAISRSESAGR